MKYQLPPIYPITDRRISGLTHAEQVIYLAEGGARLIQIREKHLTTGEFFNEALAAVKAGHERGVKIIINDRVDVALLSGADGVHLGQNDLRPVEARRLLGENAIIGYSTHSLAEAAEAVGLPIDYIAFGPVFQTATKPDAEPAAGPEKLSKMKRAIGQLPLVAIGGINSNNLVEVFQAGADSAAMISCLLAEAKANGPDMIVKRLREVMDIAI